MDTIVGKENLIFGVLFQNMLFQNIRQHMGAAVLIYDTDIVGCAGQTTLYFVIAKNTDIIRLSDICYDTLEPILTLEMHDIKSVTTHAQHLRNIICMPSLILQNDAKTVFPGPYMHKFN